MTRRRSSSATRLGVALAVLGAALAALVVTAAGPAHADPRVGGDIGARYQALGGAAGLLGQPTSGEIRTPNGRGAYVTFQRGTIHWSPATGAWETRGAIHDKWAQKGWENGYLGFPRTGEVRTPNGRGAYSVFQGGSVYWSPATGAHEVRGAIRDAYRWAGWENGYLGFPVTDEVRTPDGRGVYSVFQGGSVYFNPAVSSGAHVVRGAIRDTWGAYGWEAGPLGYPTSSEFDVPGGRRVNFQGGFVEWSPATGARPNLTVRDAGIQGCPNIHWRATVEQASRCVMAAWERDRYDLMSPYATNYVANVLREEEVGGTITFEGCAQDADAHSVFSNTGTSCAFRVRDPYWEYWVFLGVAAWADGAVVQDVEMVVF